MKATITSGERWHDEEKFFDARRRDPALRIVESRWSEGGGFANHARKMGVR
jgi:hypothetical protein